MGCHFQPGDIFGQAFEAIRTAANKQISSLNLRLTVAHLIHT